MLCTFDIANVLMGRKRSAFMCNVCSIHDIILCCGGGNADDDAPTATVAAAAADDDDVDDADANAAAAAAAADDDDDDDDDDKVLLKSIASPTGHCMLLSIRTWRLSPLSISAFSMAVFMPQSVQYITLETIISGSDPASREKEVEKIKTQQEAQGLGALLGHLPDSKKLGFDAYRA